MKTTDGTTISIQVMENATTIPSSALMDVLKAKGIETRAKVAATLTVMWGPERGYYVHIGGHHVSVNKGNIRKVLVCGVGGDWT